MTVDRFDLIDEPWIRVRRGDGTLEEVSIRGAFYEAADIAALAGEIPTQAAAVLRLLLAILYRSTAESRTPTQADQQWARWWEASALPVDAIDAHLGAHHERFDLLHPETPFYQVAGLHTAKGATSGLSKLIAEIPDGHQFFTTRAGPGLRSISLSEAARWVVHCQAFDPSGIKTGAVGDPRVKGSRGYPIGVGWVGATGLIIAEGASLRETLLLNLALDPGSDPAMDLAVWERSAHDAAPERGHPEPTGVADLLTWQSRRLRLLTSDGRVTDALVSNGDPLHPRNRMSVEMMTAFRRSSAQEKLHKQSPIYLPARHSPDRAIWRGLSGLLGEVERHRGSGAEQTMLQPEILHWLVRQRDAEALPAEHVVRLRAVGIDYINNQSIVGSVIDDVVTVHAAALSDEALRRLAIDGVEAAYSAVRALSQLADNLATAAGGDAGGPGVAAAEAGYHGLDEPYRRWLSGLRAGTDREVADRAWHSTVRSVLWGLGDSLVGTCTEKAWSGRDVERRSGGTVRLDAALATMWFSAALRESTPHADPDTSTHTTSVDEKRRRREQH